MGMRQKQMNHVEAQSLSGVFDVDYYQHERKVETMPERRLSAQEWEQKLRDEERSQKKGRAQRMREELEETNADPVLHSSRFGSFSGANVVESDVSGEKATANSKFEVEITAEQKAQMQAQGINVDHLETGKKVKINKIKWSRS